MRSFPKVILTGLALALLGSGVARGAPASPFSQKTALAKLGKNRLYQLFALKTRQPVSWAKSSYASYSDPLHLRRLQVEDRRVPLGYLGGKQRYYKHPVVVELWLKKPARPAQVLQRWMQTRLKNIVVQGNHRRWTIRWQANKLYRYKLAGGRTLLVRMMVGGARPSAYAKPLAVQLCGALLLHGKHAAVVGAGLASSTTYQGLSARSKQLVGQGFATVYQQVMLVASLGRIKLPGRVTSLERRLLRKKRFLHASRWASSVGTLSKTRYAQYRRLDIRFYAGRKCAIRDDFSTLYQHTQRSIWDDPGTTPARTGSAGGAKKWTPRSRFEVRRGTGGQHWLVVYLKGGPTFYTLQRRKTKRCSKKRVRGLAVGGLVEGVFSTYRGWCVYTPVRRAKIR